MTTRLLLLVAQGFGVGRIRLAPGTFGSLLGIPWFLLLLWPRHLGVFAAGALGGVLASVWICGVAERVLGRTDPPSVVLDEIVAVPLCLAGWVTWFRLDTGGTPTPDFFLTGRGLLTLGGAFAAFRLFDITKPWPIRASQNFAAGWGITLDDVLAACYVNLVLAVPWWWAR